MIGNYLKDKYPEIFSQINVEKTLEKYPGINLDKITSKSHLIIFWNCEKHGAYECQVSSKVAYNFSSSGCPYCSHRKLFPGETDLESWSKNNNRQDILDSWDYEKNIILPSEILYASNKEFWFKCDKCGGEYKQVLYTKSLGNNRCPYCSNKRVLPGFNDLETWVHNHTEFQYILDEWDYSKNIIKPSEMIPHSTKKIWFICPNNHSYCAKICNRLSNHTDCPYCAGKKVIIGVNDLKTWCIQNNRQDILDEWDYSKNTVTPENISQGSGKKVWFICKNGHEYQQYLFNKTGKITGCPRCSNHHSTPELTIFEICKKYVDNNAISAYKYKNYEIDIYLPLLKYFVEYDGKHYHNSEDSIYRDNLKNKLILENPSNKIIRIKETTDISLFNTDNIENNIEIFYITNDSNKIKYFIRLSDILNKIFKINVDYRKIQEIFTSIKISKAGTNHDCK